MRIEIRRCALIALVLSFFSCQNFEGKKKETDIDTTRVEGEENTNLNESVATPIWQPYNDSLDIIQNANHENERMRFKFIQSKVLDKNIVFEPFYVEVKEFSDSKYQAMKPLILEQSIPEIQMEVSKGAFNYVDLVLFYLHRIYQYELDNKTTLNTIIAFNPKVLEEAKMLDQSSEGHHPIYGMPILLKDNIGASNMKTTAGAIALMENRTNDAFIVKQLKEHGALILGKVNLSEWANFVCDCPNGQSAVGGQTLNPYGRKQFDTGGSSAGSGTAVAANYAVAAVGTETSGSILSPSGQNSVVGMKPTIGLLSRTGIVPISSTLDTPGPMTKNVIDNGILLDAMMGFDEEDEKSVQADWKANWYADITDLRGLRFGAFKNYMENDSLYRLTMERIKAAGATVVEFDPPDVDFNGFLSVLNIDMKHDLPSYLSTQTINKDDVPIANVSEAVAFNLSDTLVRIPYGQARFDGILSDTTSLVTLEAIKKRLKTNGRTYFNTPMNDLDLDAILSINNYDAGAAAAAEYPALGVPMGYRPTGEPVNLTFIAKQYQEAKLYTIGAAFEKLTKARKIPTSFQE